MIISNTRKLIPIIVFVMVPFFASIVTGGAGEFGIYWILSQWLIYVGDIELGGGVVYPVGLLYIDAIILIIILLYSFYPLTYIKTKSFQKNIRKITIEYQFIIKIILIEIPILVIGTSFVLIYSNYPASLPPFSGQIALFLLQLSTYLIFSVIGATIWIFLVSARKEFRFYFAKSILNNASEQNNTDRARDLITSIQSYDKYLRRMIDMKINNSNTLFSRIMSSSYEDRNTILESLRKAFDTDSDKLQPITCLVNILDIKDNDTFLVRESTVIKIGRIGTYVIATVIPIIISIVQMVLAK
jgi:hypothetical protein